MLLSIETSCDETACCLYDLEKHHSGASALDSILSEELYSQIKIHEIYGGVVPEIASREHIKILPILINKLFQKIDPKQLKLISVTAGPGLKGCLLVGVSFAKGLAASLSLPLIPINHLEAHILSGFADCSRDSIQSEFPALVLLVSGGNTQIIKVLGVGEYEVLAETQDDAAGEAFDKIGSMLGLGYPAGRKIAEHALKGENIIPLPHPVKNSPDKFSFSGLKTAANLLLKSEKFNDKDSLFKETYLANFCKSVESIIVSSLTDKVDYWIKNLISKNETPRRIVVCGGVAANKSLKHSIETLARSHGIRAYIPDYKLCTDNAGMIAIATSFKLNLPEINNLKSQLFEVKARWPISDLSRNSTALYE